jgi:capsular polysaccharide biosynthesis protein
MMDNIHRPDANTPAQSPPFSSRLADHDSVDPDAAGAPPVPPPANPRSILRGLVSRSRLILLLWLAISIPLVCLIYVLIEPIYEASSMLRIEPSPELFGPSAKGEATGFQQYLETQRALIVSDRVLDPAIASMANLPGFPSKFPVIRNSADLKSDVRKRLGVQIIPNTYLVRVAFNSTSATEAAEIVNAVVLAFQQQNREFNSGMNKILIDNYTGYLEKLHKDIKERQQELIAFLERGNVEPFESTIDRADESARALVRKNDTERQRSRSDAVRAALLRDELNRLNSMYDTVYRKVEQFNFESQKDGMARVYLVDPASVPKTPSTNRRLKYMAILPMGIFFALLGLFLVSEIRARPSRTGGKPSEQQQGNKPREGYL